MSTLVVVLLVQKHHTRGHFDFEREDSVFAMRIEFSLREEAIKTPKAFIAFDALQKKKKGKNSTVL